MAKVRVAERVSTSVNDWVELYALNQGDGCYLTLVDLLTLGYAKYADNIVVSNMGHSLTYRALEELSRHFASFLQQHYKIKKGDRVAIMMPNCLQYYVVLHAIIRAGGVVVNINPLYKPRELQHQVNDAQCATIIITSTSAAVLSEVLADTTIKNVVVTDLGDLLGFFKGSVVNFVVKYVKRLVKAFNIPQAIYFKQALTLGRQQQFSPVECAPADLAFLQYTGGTTGVAKGAMISHANMCANVWQCRTWAGEHLRECAKVALCPLPLYHIFSLMINAFSVFTVGGNVVLVTDPRDIPGLVKLFRSYPVTMFTSLNTLYNALLNNEEFRRGDFSTLKLAIGGGMATRPSVAAEWQKVTKNCIIDGYGLTETSPVVSINPIDSRQFSGSVGKPTVATSVEFRDDQGHVVPNGEVGELCVEGPQVMLGYWNNPQETALVLSADGWLKTGDMGKFNAQGFITLVDRKKEMISVSAFKVYPNEVEEVLTSHPGILEAAVIGVPDEASGEHVKAFVVKKDPKLTADDILAYCRDKLTAYKRPHEIEFRDSLPKSNVGKVLRRLLRDEEQK
jgi:long-chain acyl-CoA synthetase